MKVNESLTRLAFLAAGIWSLCALGEETAVVKEGRVNVRGQPSLVGEVITQLQKGEKVVVLEEVTVAKPKTNEPPKWARIRMPPNTPVWVFSSFINPADKTVRVSRINLRAGPGENYSVVGRLERGAAVTEIRSVEDWIEIETPPTAYAFVAADLLAPGDASLAKADAVPSESAPAAPAPKPESEPASPVSAPPIPESNSIIATNQVAASPAVAVDQSAPPPIPPPTEHKEETPTTSAPVEAAPPAAASPSAKAKADAQLVRRVVRREGLVRSTVSIQAPTYYELLSVENHKTINYLHTDKVDLKLEDYLGRRIVVTGEESIDPRWPRTPVLEVETLELIP